MPGSRKHAAPERGIIQHSGMAMRVLSQLNACVVDHWEPVSRGVRRKTHHRTNAKRNLDGIAFSDLFQNIGDKARLLQL